MCYDQIVFLIIVFSNWIISSTAYTFHSFVCKTDASNDFSWLQVEDLLLVCRLNSHSSVLWSNRLPLSLLIFCFLAMKIINSLSSKDKLPSSLPSPTCCLFSPFLLVLFSPFHCCSTLSTSAAPEPSILSPPMWLLFFTPCPSPWAPVLFVVLESLSSEVWPLLVYEGAAGPSRLTQWGILPASFLCSNKTVSNVFLYC